MKRNPPIPANTGAPNKNSNNPLSENSSVVSSIQHPSSNAHEPATINPQIKPGIVINENTEAAYRKWQRSTRSFPTKKSLPVFRYLFFPTFLANQFLK